MNDIAEGVEQEVIVTTAKPAPKAATSKPKPKPQPQYAVIVLDDDQHTYNYVIEALSRVCGYSLERALQFAIEIDSLGRSIVWTGSLEVAELKRDQIKEFGTDHYGTTPVTFPLGCDIEPLA